MQHDVFKNTGNVTDSDFNDNVGHLNDVSDIKLTGIQYTSSVLDHMIADGVYDSLCGLVRSVKIANKSDNFLIGQIRKRFNTYCSVLTAATFKRWLGGEYKELSEAYHFGKDMALGELLSIGMNVVRKNRDSIEGGEFALKLIDRLDDGLISTRNKPDTADKSNSASSETVKTLGKLVLELETVEEPPDESCESNDSEEES